MSSPQHPEPVPPHLPVAPPVNPAEQAPPPRTSGGRNGFGTTLLATLVWVPVNFFVAVAILGGLPSARVAGAFIGSMIVPAVVAALATWLIARRSERQWEFWKLVLLALPFFLVIRILFGVR
ncbi:hypothetical protein FHU38_001219 [Saccharomonospora amisosensis]|uniref:Uncharacterized protein n=1 Tax=Saccharomonospora amisosensis TaxID=1128677 RepID=A0A7X5UMR1_9PSEU|nr:hypothetical protein [Saccharomonospora amisosensis]NIJ10875.1 hypothetical protein [Saccharomonospora amisosensis]